MTYKINPETALLAVIPANAETCQIDGGSAILALEVDGMYRIYYEGNRFGADNMETIEGRLLIAAGRLLCKAPTVAFLVLDKATFEASYIVTGTYRYLDRELKIDAAFSNVWSAWVSRYLSRSDKAEARVLMEKLQNFQEASAELSNAFPTSPEILHTIMSKDYPFDLSFDEEHHKLASWVSPTVTELNKLIR